MLGVQWEMKHLEYWVSLQSGLLVSDLARMYSLFSTKRPNAPIKNPRQILSFLCRAQPSTGSQ